MFVRVRRRTTITRGENQLFFDIYLSNRKKPRVLVSPRCFSYISPSSLPRYKTSRTILPTNIKSTSKPPPPPSLSIYLYMCTYNTYVDRVNKIRKKYVGKIRLLKFIRTWYAFSFFNHQTSHAFISLPPLPKTSKPSPHCLYSSLTSLTCTNKLMRRPTAATSNT